jgi:hypothetical protein
MFKRLRMTDAVLSPEAYENIVSGLRVELEELVEDKRFKIVVEMVKLLSNITPIYKRIVVRSNYYSNFNFTQGHYLEVGFINAKGDIHFLKPKIEVKNIDVVRHNQYDGYFYVVDIITQKPVEPANYADIEQVVVNGSSIGFMKDGKVTYWQQYED